MVRPHGESESVARQIADLVQERLDRGRIQNRDREQGWNRDRDRDGGPQHAGRPLRVLGLAGPPGTGKSTVASLVADLLAARGVAMAGLAPMDGFHLSNTVLEDLERADRKGAPDTFDVWGYAALLARIHESSHTVYAPGYRRDLHEPVAAMNAVEPEGLAITEGNYLSLNAPGWREARELIDLLVFVDTPRTELLRRLVARQEAFGRDRVAAAHWVRTVDAANIDLVARSRSRADVVVTAG